MMLVKPLRQLWAICDVQGDAQEAAGNEKNTIIIITLLLINLKTYIVGLNIGFDAKGI